MQSAKQLMRSGGAILTAQAGQPMNEKKVTNEKAAKEEKKVNATSATAKWCHNEACIRPGELEAKMPWHYLGKDKPVYILWTIEGNRVVLTHVDKKPSK